MKDNREDGVVKEKVKNSVSFKVKTAVWYELLSLWAISGTDVCRTAGTCLVNGGPSRGIPAQGSHAPLTPSPTLLVSYPTSLQFQQQGNQ
jgi:hypothetical protein